MKNKNTTKQVVESWINGIDIEATEGLREPQKGAIYAIKSHWTVSDEIATVVLPTGTGKTDTMISVVVSERIEHCLVIVPNIILRDQTVDNFKKLGVLREKGVIKQQSNVMNPIVEVLKSKPKSVADLENLTLNANVLVSTMALLKNFPPEYIDALKKYINVLIIDEAHHVPANTWNRVKNSFDGIKILQFTATPFRNDGQHLDGNIIYNFPLKKAQEQKYFKKIELRPISEYDDSKADEALARRAVELLNDDMNAGYNHLLLARANSIKDAERLYSTVYQKFFPELNPVIIHNKSKNKDEALNMLKNGESRIVVCVNMFGEGVDIPNLKICAMHSSYSSLPITLQFIGRFARTAEHLGCAKIVTNLADDHMCEKIADLYTEDADWNYLISDLSNTATQEEIELKKVINGFNPHRISNINLELVQPKMSAIVYLVGKDQTPNYYKLKNYFSDESDFVTVNKEAGLVAIVERSNALAEWSRYKDMTDQEWNLHLAYWDAKHCLLFINSSTKQNEDNLAKLLFESPIRIKGEQIFRCLYNIKRLLVASFGLKQEIRGPIRYKMYAGADVLEGLTESQKENHTKANLFGYGYNGNGPISMGCSYKGRIWGREIGNINSWLKWCKQQSLKLIDSKINIDSIIKGVLRPREVKEFPKSVPYAVDWPCDLDTCINESVYLVYKGEKYGFNDIGIAVDTDTVSADYTVTKLKIYNDRLTIPVDYMLKDGRYSFTVKGGNEAFVKKGKKIIPLGEFFYNNSPTIWYVDFSSLQGNYLVEYTQSNIELDEKQIVCEDWTGIDIHKESADHIDNPNCIQQRMMEKLIAKGSYNIVFDDDDAGEIADIVAVKEDTSAICIELYHCKYSHGKNPGSRVNDLYEVCGQAVKSIQWCKKYKDIPERLIERENLLTKKGLSRFRLGSMKDLKIIQRQIRTKPVKLSIAIVQPGVDSRNITEEMKRVICSTATHLKETYSINLKMYFS